MWPVTSASSTAQSNPSEDDENNLINVHTTTASIAPYRPFEITSPTTFIIPDSSNDDAFIRASNAFPSPESNVSVTIGTIVNPVTLTSAGSGGLGGIIVGGHHLSADDLSPPLNSLTLGTNWTLSMSPTSDDRTSNVDTETAKMSVSEAAGSHLHKGLDDQHMSGLYGHRSNSSASSSPPAHGGPVNDSGGANGGLVVPQPINAAKGGHGGHSHHGSHGNHGHHVHHHMSHGGPGTTNGSAGRKYQCKMCPQVGKIFGSKADLQLHTQIHMREAKPYKCTQCNKSFANSSYLSQHTRIHLGIKPYKCEICQRKFTQLSHLQQHIRTHTGDKPYKCRHPGCTKAFSQLSNLQSHSRCHQTDKPYKCNSCYKCFVDEQALLEHIPKHKESKHLKTHICQYCGKSYTQETYLAKHMQKHSDRKEPRAPIASMGGTNGTSGQGNGQTNGNNTANTTGGNSLAALGSATSTSSVSQSVVDSYWQKVDPAAYAAHAAHHDRSGDYLGMADPRLNPHAAHQAAAQAVAARDMDMQRDMDAMRHAQLTGGYGDPSGAGVAKTSSAFSPIQGSMLQTAAAAQAAASQGAFAMSAGSRGYSFYDPIGFPKHHSQVGFDSKPGVGGANCFPNQLISLSQIRNYAHQPELLHSLKEK